MEKKTDYEKRRDRQVYWIIAAWLAAIAFTLCMGW